jgi:preprotein translocase subunit SecB
MAETKEPEVHFSLERIYIKDASYEAPGVPQVFLQKTAPQVDVQLAVNHIVLDAANGFHEVVLTATVQAKGGDTTVFLVEVQQAGVFRIHGLAGENLERAVEIGAPNILLPFVREAVNDFICKGGFPQLLLNPINFETLYEQKKAAQQKQPGAKQH